MSKKLYLPNKFKILRDVEEMVNQRGMTFIEVLVALFILVTGILGAVAMQTTAKQSSFDAMQRSLASSLAQDIIERMRNNNADVATLASYNGTYGDLEPSVPEAPCNTIAANCTNEQIQELDIFEWTQALRGANERAGETNVGGLLNPRGCISNVGQVVTVSISWHGKTETVDSARDTDCGDNSSRRRQIQLTVFIF